MIFRPYPGFTIFVAICIALLCGLGVWQMERLSWKLDLIARIQHGLAAAPVPLDEALKLGQAPPSARRRPTTRRSGCRGVFAKTQRFAFSPPAPMARPSIMC